MRNFTAPILLALAVLFLGGCAGGQYVGETKNGVRHGKEVAAKLSIKLPSNMGIVPYGEDGTMLYMVTKPSNQEKGIILSMQGSDGYLYSTHGPIQDEETLISKGGPSPRHPSIMIKSSSN